MNHQNLANLTRQYQQAYLIYCYKVMQYLQALAWLAEHQKDQKEPQNQTNTTKVKSKSASGVKKLAKEVNQKKLALKSLKHQEKPDVSTITAIGFPNGAMSAAFRVAFNEILEFGDGTKTEAQEQDERIEAYKAFHSNLTKPQRIALFKANRDLQYAMSVDIDNNDARQNNVIGLGLFAKGKTGFVTSDVSITTYDGVIQQSPLLTFCNDRCEQSVSAVANKGLIALMFRHKGSKNMMSVRSKRLQSLSNLGNVPVMLRDVYHSRTYLWTPEVNNEH